MTWFVVTICGLLALKCTIAGPTLVVVYLVEGGDKSMLWFGLIFCAGAVMFGRWAWRAAKTV